MPTKSSSSGSILPSYQRLLKQPAGQLFVASRRSFRPREKYLIFLVLLTFGIVCFGAFFFLPEDLRANAGVNSVYRAIQKAGPDLLIPVPPRSQEDEVSQQMNVVLIHHGLPGAEDVHVLEDKQRLQAKIDQEYQKTLEKPEVLQSQPVRTISSMSTVMARHLKDNRETVPPEPSDRYPVITGGVDPDPVTRERRDHVKKMMKYSWDNYKLYAWGNNELRPESKTGHSASIFGSSKMGATIVDGLDTLYIMGLHDEYEEGRDWIAQNLTFDIDAQVSLFEMNIRFLGGLLACYALTGDVMFRDKAADLGKRMLPAFTTHTGIPHSLINFRTKDSNNYGWANNCSILSEIGTLHLEFTYLSDITGNSIFRDKVEKVRSFLKGLDKPKGLYPNYIHPETGKWGRHHMSLGGLGDSFYEYLLKSWIQLGKKDNETRKMYDEAMDAVVKHMIKRSTGGLLYLSEIQYERVEHKMGHLACFAGGMFALGAKTLENKVSDQHMKIATGLTNTCHESYIRSKTKLGPEAFHFVEGNEAKSIKNSEKYYILRPETIESYFVLWRLTKDPKYREWGWEAVEALEKNCLRSGGYSGILNVYKENPSIDDVQQSYFLAETLKYLYLLFSDDELISLDEWVFNSEAHVLPVKGANPLYRPYSS